MYSAASSDPVPHLLRRFDVRVDRRDDADEDPLVGLHVLADDLQDARAIAFARQRDVEVPDLQLEQARQQLGVVDVGAVRRIAVAARAGVHADALALSVENRASARLFRSMKLCRSSPDGSIFIARRPSVKSIWTLWAPFARQRRISVSCSRQQIVDELLARVARDAFGRIHQAQAPTAR